MKNLCALFLLSFSSLLPSNAFAGAWLQPHGKGQLITSLRYYSASEFVDADGEREDIDRFNKIEISPYVEYGLRSRLTIGGELSYASMDDGTPEITYASIFARTPLYQAGSHMLSLEPGLTYPRQIGSELSPDGENIIPELKLNYGYGFKLLGRDHFVDTGMKYRFRSGDGLEDMVKSEATIGLSLSDKYMAMLQITDERSVQDNDIIGNYTQIKPQISVLYKGDRFSHQLGASKDIYSRNTGQGYGFMYSLWYSF